MPVLFLTEDDVRRVLTMEMALEAVENGLRQLALDEATNVPRARCQTDQAMLHVLSASARSLGVMGYKAYSTSRGGANFHLGLYDGQSGALLALMQADYLGQMRTGAASGVATEYMARPDAAPCGRHTPPSAASAPACRCQTARPRWHVSVYSRDAERRSRFAADMSELCRTEVVPVPRPELAAEDKDIVITATTSREPVLNGHWLAEGTHLNVIGSNFLTKAEIDAVAVRRCDSIVVDSKDQARLEAGDLVAALDDGSIHWSDIHELGQVIIGRYTGRAHPEDVTLFKSVGIAIEDVAVAARVWQAAQAAGIGRPIDW
jgi:ornithine cyclodeaminase/alanine dehydrogenase